MQDGTANKPSSGRRQAYADFNYRYTVPWRLVFAFFRCSKRLWLGHDE